MKRWESHHGFVITYEYNTLFLWKSQHDDHIIADPVATKVADLHHLAAANNKHFE